VIDVHVVQKENNLLQLGFTGPDDLGYVLSIWRAGESVCVELVDVEEGSETRFQIDPHGEVHETQKL
jgi:hypothetical protein